MTRQVGITEEQAVALVLREVTAAVGHECPPHKFSSAWASSSDPSLLGDDNTVPCLYCSACGEVRALRVPE